MIKSFFGYKMCYIQNGYLDKKVEKYLEIY